MSFEHSYAHTPARRGTKFLMETGDFNADSKLDLVVADDDMITMYDIFGLGDGDFHYRINRAILAGDFNCNGLDYLLWNFQS